MSAVAVCSRVAVSNFVSVDVAIGVVTYDSIHLLGDEVDITAADGDLREPDRNVNEEFTVFAPNFTSYFTVRVKFGMFFSNLKL